MCLPGATLSLLDFDYSTVHDHFACTAVPPKASQLSPILVAQIDMNFKYTRTRTFTYTRSEATVETNNLIQVESINLYTFACQGWP